MQKRRMYDGHRISGIICSVMDHLQTCERECIVTISPKGRFGGGAGTFLTVSLSRRTRRLNVCFSLHGGYPRGSDMR